MLYFKKEEEKALFLNMMARFDKAYDDADASLSQWRGEHGYHSTLQNQIVHSTRDSLAYSYQLYNRDGAGDRERAEKILRRIVPLQDVDPSHKTYGIWAYYTEEPLTQMAPPDWNWADFCGKELLHILLEHPEKLSEGLSSLLQQALIHACNSIRIRNMEPGYTNISVMGTYVTLVTGERFERPDLFEYGKKRLRDLHRFNMANGSFKEYNSPTYSMVLVSDLARMLYFVGDPDCKILLKELNDLAWEGIARHYHFKTKQWAGPHARAYTMLQSKELRLQIQRALDYKIKLVDLGEEGVADLLPMEFFSLNLQCPEKFMRYFTEETGETEVCQAFFGADIATAYLTENFTIGNFYQCSFWNQKRNMLCYFGSEENPAYCGLKLLHDFYDYSSGVVVNSQQKNRCVSLIGFVTDGGDTHCNLDMVQNGTILASDLRVRFEFGGGIENLAITQKEEGLFYAECGGIQILITVPYVRFGGEHVYFERSREDAHINETGGHRYVQPMQALDIVLYHGEKKEIDFNALSECVCAVSFEITDRALSGQPVSVEKTGDSLRVRSGNLMVEGSSRAVSMKTFGDTFKAEIDGKEYREIYCK